MHRQTKHGVAAFFLAALIAVLLASCATEQGAPEEETPVVQDPAWFLEHGRALMVGASQEQFVRHVNMHGDQLTAERETLLRELAEQQEAVVEQLLVDGDPLAALKRVGTLRALPDGDARLVAILPLIEDGLRAGGFEAMAESLAIANGAPVGLPDPLIVDRALEEYRRILAQVHVTTYYENDDGIERFSPDSFAGSGFLLTNDLALTAYHVIEQIHYDDTTRYEITLQFGDQSVDADVLAWDSILDIAVLSLDTPVDSEITGLERLSPRTSVERGEYVYALGHHSGLAETLTGGIVSAPSRHAPELGSWIQVDASVTGGASGGMVIDSDGYIVGVIVAGLLYEDLNFAIPSADIRSVIDVLMHGDSVRRPWLGLSLQEEATDGGTAVQIRDVFPSSPLSDMGVNRGALIRSVNGTPVTTVEAAQDVISDLWPGNIVSLVVESDGTERELLVVTGSRPDFALYNGHGEFDRIATLYPLFGFAIDVTLPQSVQITHEGGSTEIVLYPVTAVESGGFLQSRGVQVGDLIGFVADEYYDMTREIVLFHLPTGHTLGDLHDLDDYVYIMRRGRYDQNIL